MDDIEISNHKTFVYDKIGVFFKHTDYHGFVHPYNFLEWMSYAREAFFQELVPNFMELCQRDIKMVTSEVEYQATADAFFGDKIVIKIFSEKVKRLSFEVIFNFYREEDNTLLGEGRMRLTFLDATSGRPTLIPEELKKVVLEFERKHVSKDIRSNLS